VTATPKPKDPPTDDVNEPLEGGDDQYVTKGELRGLFEEFFGKGTKPTDDGGDDIDLDGKDALGVYSIRELEAMIERQVKGMTKSLAASKPAVDENDKPPAKDEKVREDKPTTLDVTSLVERAKGFLWGAR
jgi:hypothetical protein